MKKERFLNRIKAITEKVKKSKCLSIEAKVCDQCDEIVKELKSLVKECNN